MRRLKRLTAREWEDLTRGAEILESDGSGAKVLRLPDNTFIKLFRRKRFFSSALFYPYACRFADNARALKTLGVPCPEILLTARVPAIARDLVRYVPLAGHTLRQELASRTCEREPALDEREKESARIKMILTAAGAFVARLHETGVYFRSLHLGNIVRGGDGEFGLIDFADLSCRSRPLSDFLRRRNFRHIFRLSEDRALLLADHGEAFAAGYHSVSRAAMPRLPI